MKAVMKVSKDGSFEERRRFDDFEKCKKYMVSNYRDLPLRFHYEVHDLDNGKRYILAFGNFIEVLNA